MLDRLLNGGDVTRVLTDAEIYALIEDARQAAMEKQYWTALEAVQGMAAVNPNDPWAQGIAYEARLLFIEAEPHVSLSEVLREKGEWREAIAELRAAIRAYDHLPGLWPLMFWLLPGWELALRISGRTVGDAEIQQVKQLREEASAKMSQREPRMTWESRSGDYTFTVEEPWPEVVRAFCDSRPAAKVEFGRSEDVATPSVEVLEGTIADTIRATREPRESWNVSLQRRREEEYVLIFRHGDVEKRLELAGLQARHEKIRGIVVEFLRAWPSSS